MVSTPNARERIIESATELMWRDGYDAISVDVICAAANVRKGSFYHAFPSKEELLNELIRTRWEADRPEIEQIYNSEGSALLKFRNHLEWFGISQRRLMVQHGFVPGVFNMAVGVNAPSSTRALIVERREAHLAIVTQAIGAIFDREDSPEGLMRWRASIVSQLINGAIIDARLHNTLAPYESLPESIMAVLGLGAPPLLLMPDRSPQAEDESTTNPAID